MCVNTILRRVVYLRIRTPNCLIVEVVEVDVGFELINQVDGDFAFGVREGAVVAVLALAAEPYSAELCSVLVRVVEFLDTGVTVDTGITLRALFFLRNEAAELGFVRTRGSASVLGLLVVI